MVALQHPLEVAFPDYKSWSLEYINMGRVGIVAFFLVSGYVVGLTLSNQTPRVFSIRRFWRLYPVYWAATIIYVLTLAATGTVSPDTTLLVVLVNVSMIQGFVGVYSILGVAWTLGVEIAFYAQSVVGKFARILDKTVWLGLFWITVFAAMGVANFIAGFDFSAVGPLMMFTASLGFSLYLWERNRSRALLTLGPLALFAVPVLGWFLESSGGGVSDGWTPLGFDLSYALGIAVFASCYAYRNRRSSPTLLWLGKVSYALYLFHPIVIVAIEPLDLPPALFVAIACAASLVVAWAVHVLIERPATDFGRRASTRRPTS